MKNPGVREPHENEGFYQENVSKWSLRQISQLEDDSKWRRGRMLENNAAFQSFFTMSHNFPQASSWTICFLLAAHMTSCLGNDTFSHSPPAAQGDQQDQHQPGPAHSQTSQPVGTAGLRHRRLQDPPPAVHARGRPKLRGLPKPTVAERSGVRLLRAGAARPLGERESRRRGSAWGNVCPSNAWELTWRPHPTDNVLHQPLFRASHLLGCGSSANRGRGRGPPLGGWSCPGCDLYCLHCHRHSSFQEVRARREREWNEFHFEKCCCVWCEETVEWGEKKVTGKTCVSAPIWRKYV